MSEAKTANKKTRRKIPKAVVDKVKQEFHHRCALCRADYCEVHHIDEDPSNNDPDNLIPLCPNCHHGRVHGRGGHRIDAGALRRYRTIGNRFVATPAYDLLLRRTAYITSEQFHEMDWQQIDHAYQDLRSFVADLRFGKYFVEKLDRLMRPASPPNLVHATIIGPGHDVKAQREQQERKSRAVLEEHLAAYKRRLQEVVGEIADVLDEILMAQQDV